MVTQTKLDPIIEPYRHHISTWATIWGLTNLPDQVTIEFSNRLRSSIGLCYPERSLIRLHPVVRELDEPMFLEILCHELAHIAVYQQFGRGCRPHGREWKTCLTSAGFTARATLPSKSIFATPAQRATRKTVLWHHRCPRCHASRTARRPVYSWRCSTCRKRGRAGKLKITREEIVG
jgi:predicted SprT family Zn-dependent metalloprotease